MSTFRYDSDYATPENEAEFQRWTEHLDKLAKASYASLDKDLAQSAQNVEFGQAPIATARPGTIAGLYGWIRDNPEEATRWFCAFRQAGMLTVRDILYSKWKDVQD